VQSRLQALYEKLGVDQDSDRDPDGAAIYNSRSRAVSIAFLRRLVNGKAIEAAELDYQAWATSKSGAASSN